MDAKKNKSFKLPTVWEDDMRMNVLFAPFRPKSLNPIDWSSKLEFWEEIICQHCLHENKTIFSLAAIKKSFSRNGKMPACLDVVIEEMLRSGIIVHANAYKSYSLTPESYSQWAARLLLKNPMAWAIDKVTTPFSSEPDPNTAQYVHIVANKKLSEEYVQIINEKSPGKLVDIKEVSKIIGVSDEALKVILRPLIEEKRVSVTITPSETLLKFARDDEKVTPVSEIDLGMYKLEKNEEQLKNCIESLEGEREAALKEVKSCLSKNRRQSAKTWLRRKNELEKCIDKRASALENIRCLLDKIRYAETDSLVLDAYKQGINALKETFRATGLREQEAENTMDELQDVLDVHKEIEATLSASLDPEADSSLEDELAQIMMDIAPDVPPTSPSSGHSGAGHEHKPVANKKEADGIPSASQSVPLIPELDLLPSIDELPDVQNIDAVLEARIKALEL